MITKHTMNKQSNKKSNSLILEELQLFRLCVTDEIRSLKDEIVNLCNQIANSKSAHLDSMKVLNNQHKNVSLEDQVESFGNTGIKLQPNFDDGANEDINKVNEPQSVDSLNVIKPKNNVENSLVQEYVDSEELSEFEIEYFRNADMNLQPSLVIDVMNEGNTADMNDSELGELQSNGGWTNNEGSENMQSCLDSTSTSYSVSGQESSLSDSDILPIIVKIGEWLGASTPSKKEMDINEKCDHSGNAEEGNSERSSSVSNSSKQLQSYHGKIETGENANNDTFKHQQCGNRFSLLSDIVTDNRIHTGGKAFACKQCGKMFAHANTMKEHMRIHTGVKPFSCEYCGKQFNDFSNLKSHIRTLTGEKSFKYKECHKRFSQFGNLKSHVRTHTGERPFQCEECHQCFTQSAHLKSHMRTHSKEKSFQCKECHQRFALFGNLKSHMRTHTGERPFECKECHRCFARSSTLKIHVKTHTGEKPFKCKECLICFARSDHLKSHIRTHTGEKPFKCKVCHQCFTQSSTLISHMRIHTGEKPFKCKECHKCFTLSGHLKSHVKTHTG